MVENEDKKEEKNATESCSIMLEHQNDLPRLPIPELKDTLLKFRTQSVSALVHDEKELEDLESLVKDFEEKDGPKLQQLLQEYTSNNSSFVEEFWSEAYLAPDTSVVLNLNPFFLFQGSPYQQQTQVQRASSLVCCTCKFAVMVQEERLKPDVFKNVPLCMDQFKALFGSCRIPKIDSQDVVEVSSNSQHIVVFYRNQMYCFPVLTMTKKGDKIAVCVNEEDISSILTDIIQDGNKTSEEESIQKSLGVLTTLPRKDWAVAKQTLMQISEKNRNALEIIDSALFILCLDDFIPKNIHEAASNMLHGSTKLVENKETKKLYQGGTCSNRWYDKLQIIVTKDGNAGINFEHSALDGHTALRMASDVYAESVVQLAQSIVTTSIQIPSVISAPLERAQHKIHPKKLSFDMTPPLQRTIFHAETALSDQIVSNDTHVLEYTSYGKCFIVSNKISPDSFVQISILLAYYRLYGKIVSQYEPVLTKRFYHGRTEAMRTATKPAVTFCQTFVNPAASYSAKIEALQKATQFHSKVVKECAMGHGVERHLFALSCIADKFGFEQPKFFQSTSWKILNHTVLSTSNCGNPALRLFGFGPVVPDGYGVGYIIKDNSLSYSIASKHRQTQRFANMLESTLDDLQQLFLKSATRFVDKPSTKSLKRNESSLSSQPEYLDGMDFYGETTTTLPPPRRNSTKQDDDLFVGRTYKREGTMEFQTLKDLD